MIVSEPGHPSLPHQKEIDLFQNQNLIGQGAAAAFFGGCVLAAASPMLYIAFFGVHTRKRERALQAAPLRSRLSAAFAKRRRGADPAAPKTPKTPPTPVPPPDRRNLPRIPLRIPVQARFAEGLIEGYTENLSGSGALIHAFSAVPEPGDLGRITFQWDAGVEAEAKIVRVVADARDFALQITRVLTNGERFLAEFGPKENAAPA
jgi:hypothetical protein